MNIPAEVLRREDHKAALQQARTAIEARVQELAAASNPTTRATKRQVQRDAGKKPRGPGQMPPSATPDPKAQ